MIFPCTPCQDYWDGWRDYVEPYRKWIQYEKTGKRSVESYHQKAQERRDLVRRQQDMQLESCRRKGCLEQPAKEKAA